jgi:hypothetical protein
MLTEEGNASEEAIMIRPFVAGFLALWAACSYAGPAGEHLAYVVGCINCHHQTPKELINAPPLVIVQTYTLDEFTRLLRTGITRSGRNLLDASSLMGITATEQFSHMTDGEIGSIYDFLSKEWTTERAGKEEAKIPLLYKAAAKNGS